MEYSTNAKLIKFVRITRWQNIKRFLNIYFKLLVIKNHNNKYNTVVLGIRTFLFSVCREAEE